MGLFYQHLSPQFVYNVKQYFYKAKSEPLSQLEQ